MNQSASNQAPVRPASNAHYLTDLPTDGGLTDLMQQFAVLWKYKWQIGACTALFTMIGIYAALSATPIYRATTTLFIEAKSANVVEIDEVYDGFQYTDVYRNTQYEILKSGEIAQRVVQAIDLTGYEEFSLDATEQKAKAFGGILSKIKLILGSQSASNDQAREVSQAVGENGAAKIQLAKILKSKIRIEPVPNSQLVKVHAMTEDKRLSVLLANAWVKEYLKAQLESKLGVTSQATGWLNQRLEKVRQDLEESERKLQEFYESQELINLGGARGILEEEFSDNARRLREARRKTTDLENVYRKIVDSGDNIELLQEITPIESDSLVQSTKRNFLAAREAVGELEGRYGPKHPTMIAAQSKLKEARDAYYRQLRLAADGIKSEYEIARNTVNSLAGIVDSSKNQLVKLDRKEYQLQLLQREVTTNRELFKTLLTRFKETDISSNLDISNTRIVDPAILPTSPFRPRKKLWVLCFLVLGLISGAGIALLRAYLDDKVKSPSQLEAVTGMPILGSLPFVKAYKNKAKKLSVMEVAEPDSVFAEGIRTIRTSVLLADTIQKRKSIIVTSSEPSEGKTSVAVNLALAFAQMERVLLVDGDMRRPSIANYLDLPKNSRGLNEVLSGEVSLRDCILNMKDSALHILPCMTAPPSPSEIISSQRFHKLMNSIEGHYDRIIIDSPPCQAVSDALLLGSMADGTIFLTKADATSRKLIANSVKQLRNSNVSILGAILNQAVPEKHNKYEYGYYYHQDYYGKA